MSLAPSRPEDKCSTPCLDTRPQPCSWPHRFLVVIHRALRPADGVSLSLSCCNPFLGGFVSAASQGSAWALYSSLFLILPKPFLLPVFFLVWTSRAGCLYFPCSHITLSIDCANVYHCYNSFVSLPTFQLIPHPLTAWTGFNFSFIAQCLLLLPVGLINIFEWLRFFICGLDCFFLHSYKQDYRDKIPPSSI